MSPGSSLALALGDFEECLTPEIAARLATAAMRLSLAAFAYMRAKEGDPPAAALLLSLSDELTPIRQKAA